VIIILTVFGQISMWTNVRVPVNVNKERAKMWNS